MRRLCSIAPFPLARASLLALLGAGILSSAPAEAKRIFVPRQHKRLQAAIDAASPGDTVWVSAGTYRGPFALKKRLVLFGEAGPESTILDGGDTTRVLHIENVSHAAVLGFRIQHGKSPGGGGIYCLRDTLLVIGSCDIRFNWEGGIAGWKCTQLQIADTEISENKGSGILANDSRLQLLRVKLRRNHGSAGGGISLVSSEIMMARDSAFEENRADEGTGGGVNAESSIARFLNCSFRGNSSAVSGGAIAGRDSSELRIRQSRFTENHAATGGAVLADRSEIGVDLSIFDKNRATAAGCAVQIIGRRTSGVNPLIYGNTFYRNGAVAEGGAMFVQDVSPEIHHNIFVVDSTAKNKAVLELRGSPRYDCNLLHTLGGSAAVGPSANTLVGDPLFCDAEQGDFHVRDLSPAILSPCGKIGALGKGCASFRPVPSR